jgi:Fe-S cluster assembly protein SufD
MKSLQAMRTPVEDALIAEAARSAGANDNRSPLRTKGLQQLQEYGLPHRRVEQWKYTDLRSFWREPLAVAQKPNEALIAAAKQLPPAFDAERIGLSFVNGHFIQASELPKGMEVISLEKENNVKILANALEGWNDPLLALNSAFLNAGAVIRLAKNAVIEKIIHLDFRTVGSASASYPRIIVLIEEGARGTFFETHVSAEETYACNGVVMFICAKDSRVDHIRMQAQSKKTIHVLSSVIELGKNTNFNSFALEQGSGLSRNQYFIRQKGENAQIGLAGVTLAAGKQHLDTTLIVDHAVPHGVSREQFRQVIANEARGVFQGKVIVRPHAQKADGRMNARGLLLSESAEFYAKPELEIYADDVLCAHGATAGQLDQDLLFYLRARGINEHAAKALLTKAFLAEPVEQIANEALRAAMMARCEAWLSENFA